MGVQREKGGAKDRMPKNIRSEVEFENIKFILPTSLGIPGEGRERSGQGVSVP